MGGGGAAKVLSVEILARHRRKKYKRWKNIVSAHFPLINARSLPTKRHEIWVAFMRRKSDSILG